MQDTRQRLYRVRFTTSGQRVPYRENAAVFGETPSETEGESSARSKRILLIRDVHSQEVASILAARILSATHVDADIEDVVREKRVHFLAVDNTGCAPLFVVKFKRTFRDAETMKTKAKTQTVMVRARDIATAYMTSLRRLLHSTPDEQFKILSVQEDAADDVLDESMIHALHDGSSTYSTLVAHSRSIGAGDGKHTHRRPPKKMARVEAAKPTTLESRAQDGGEEGGTSHGMDALIE
jgi:hypothetical protein